MAGMVKIGWNCLNQLRHPKMAVLDENDNALK